MKAAKIGLMALLLVLGFALSTYAEEKEKPTTLKGNLVCGKCTLGKTDVCKNVLVVEKDGKKKYYYLDDKGKGAAYHKKVCPPDSKAEATVTGIVFEKDGKTFVKKLKVTLK